MAMHIVSPEAHTSPRLNLAQSRVALQTIASQAATLNQLLMRVQEYSHELDHTASGQLDAAQIIAQTIGALADSASGEEILGSPERWHYGTGFVELREEVQHGSA